MKELRFTTKNNKLYINNILNPSVFLSPGVKYNIVSEIPISITRKDKTRYDINNTSMTLITPYEPETLYYTHGSIVGEIKIVKYSQKLFDAIQNQNREVIEEELESRDLDPNYINRIYDMTVLEIAITMDLPHVVKKLIEKGADVNRQLPRFNNATPLMLTLMYENSIEIVKLLIDNGANLELTDYNGETAFLYGLTIDTPYEIIKLLLERGANYNAVDTNKNTALHFVVKPRLYSKNTVEVLDLLLQYGLDPSEENIRKEKPIDIVTDHEPLDTDNMDRNIFNQIKDLLENNPYGEPANKSAAKT